MYIPEKQVPDTRLICKNSVRLPQCPLCIERLDIGISGLSALTSSDIIGYVYSHTTKGWSSCEEQCKVCRALGVSTTPTALGKTLVCHCGVNESIWVCLICSYLGCGRYQQGHAAKHFVDTGHCFAADIESGRIWHYLEDGYVHRILKTANLAPIELTDKEAPTPGNPAELSVFVPAL